MALRSLEAMVTTAGQVDSFIAVRSLCMAGCGGLASCVVGTSVRGSRARLAKALVSPACPEARASLAAADFAKNLRQRSLRGAVDGVVPKSDPTKCGGLT